MIDLNTDFGRDINTTVGVSSPSNVINSSNATAARQTLWNQFQNSTVPTLREMENQLKTRRGNFVEEATDSANKAQYMAENQARISREALGIQLTDEQAKQQSRLDALSGTSTQVSSRNEAVDVAEDINKQQAGALLNVQTGLTQEALGDLQGAQSLKDAREGNDSNRRQQARNQNLGTAGTVLTIAAMMV